MAFFGDDVAMQAGLENQASSAVRDALALKGASQPYNTKRGSKAHDV
jgi:hypothetical protein